MIVDEDGEVQLLTKLKMKIGKKIDKFKLDPTLNWQFAEIISLDNNQITFRTIKNKKKKFRRHFVFKKF